MSAWLRHGCVQKPTTPCRFSSTTQAKYFLIICTEERYGELWQEASSQPRRPLELSCCLRSISHRPSQLHQLCILLQFGSPGMHRCPEDCPLTCQQQPRAAFRGAVLQAIVGADCRVHEDAVHLSDDCGRRVAWPHVGTFSRLMLAETSAGPQDSSSQAKLVAMPKLAL